jgi:hypothetical protein
MSRIIISENQYNRLIESITYSFNNSKNNPVMNMRINHDYGDKFNTSTNNADTRVFGDRDSIIHGKSRATSLNNKVSINDIYRDALNDVIYYAKNKGGYDLYLPTQYEITPKCDNMAQSIINRQMQSLQNQIDNADRTGDYDSLYNFAVNRLKKDDIPSQIVHNKYNRANQESVNNKYIPRYNNGIIPNTNVRFISLFSMDDFNFSDALKHGKLRPNQNTDKIMGYKSDKKIPLTYDNGIPANVENNFSIGNDNQWHDKKQYGYGDENYTSATQFIDKSIMYAAMILKKGGYNPSYIVTAPSSSNFNKYYGKALANKLDGCEYVDDFYQRNLINFENSQGELIEDKMRQDGLDESYIEKIHSTLDDVAINELASTIAYPMIEFINQNKAILEDISKEHYSRERANIDKIQTILLNYSYKVITEWLKYSKSDKEPRLKKYLLDRFMNLSKGIEKNDVYILNEIKNRIRLKIGLKVFNNTLTLMFQEVAKVATMLRERKFKLNFNKVFKVTKLPKAARVYLNDIYVVADKNFNKNHEIFERFLNSKFLIVDEDLNTGITLYNLIQALKKAIPSQSDSDIMCLTNSYSSGGM